MKKSSALIPLALILVFPPLAFSGQNPTDDFRHQQKEKVQAYHQQHKTENKSFWEGLKTLSPQDKVAAIANHKNERYQENIDFYRGLHSENMEHFKTKLAQNTKLTDAQRQGLINFREEQYQETVGFRAQQHNEDMSFLEQLAKDSNLTNEEIKSQLKANRQQQRNAAQQHRQQQRVERQAKRQEIRSKLPAGIDDKKDVNL
jgi:hypothetical protein